MSGLDGLLPTSDENFMSTATLEIDLLGKMVKCSTRILPGVYQTIKTKHISAAVHQMSY